MFYMPQRAAIIKWIKFAELSQEFDQDYGVSNTRLKRKFIWRNFT